MILSDFFKFSLCVDYTVCRPVAAVFTYPFGKNTLAVDLLHHCTMFHRTSYKTALSKVDWRSCTPVIVFGFDRNNFVVAFTGYVYCDVPFHGTSVLRICSRNVSNRAAIPCCFL
jgi:hypothetical protein